MEAAHRSEFQELRQDIARLETRLVEFRAELKQDIAAALSEQIKWSFVFWLGTVGIVMLLLRYFGDAG